MIRNATKFDIPEIIELLKHYRDAGPHKQLSNTTDEAYIVMLLSYLFAGSGLVLLACKDDKAIGVLIASKSPSIWNPKIMNMQEICFWVDPEYRNGTAGYRLLKEYCNQCDEMKDKSLIDNYTVSQMVGTNLKYNKFGFMKIEETWVQ